MRATFVIALILSISCASALQLIDTAGGANTRFLRADEIILRRFWAYKKER